MAGQLFKEYFLTDGIQETGQWRESVEQGGTFAEFTDALSAYLNKFNADSKPNEAVTEQELIEPVLKLLGWADYLPQQAAARGEDIPDYLLFADSAAKQRAISCSKSQDRYQHALAVLEGKRLGLPLDGRGGGWPAHEGEQMTLLGGPGPKRKRKSEPGGAPHGQILRYLRTADSVADGKLRWGMLTNGAVWRLYDQRARPRATGFFEGAPETGR